MLFWHQRCAVLLIRYFRSLPEVGPRTFSFLARRCPIVKQLSTAFGSLLVDCPHRIGIDRSLIGAGLKRHDSSYDGAMPTKENRDSFLSFANEVGSLLRKVSH